MDQAEQPVPQPQIPPTPSPEQLVAQPQPTVNPEHLSWQASEYLYHPKGGGWYLGLIAGMVVLSVLIFLLTRQILTLIVFAIMTAALIVYGRKTPRTLTYSLDETGILIDRKQYSYDDFKSFAVIKDVGWHTIDLDPINRFSPRLSILFEDQQRDSIVAALENQLPRLDRPPDMVERLARYLKF